MIMVFLTSLWIASPTVHTYTVTTFRLKCFVQVVAVRDNGGGPAFAEKDHPAEFTTTKKKNNNRVNKIEPIKYYYKRKMVRSNLLLTSRAYYY